MDADFLAMDPASREARKVDAIVLDPSCSGSGLVRQRIAHCAQQEASAQELSAFAAAQKRMLVHAMRFGCARIVYSTCSVHEQENEAVVQHALEHGGGHFEVRKVFEQWPHRGQGQRYAFRDCVLRVPLDNDRNLHSFFVACFD